ncbi:MAG: DUF3015 domain-containing protein [Chrysiogenetes bacterium]|nr:DUF3015 domain-containing protein [Chrysiogenetes bacterium]
MKLIRSAILCAALIFAAAIPAANAASYGPAGCGLGSMIFGPSGEMRKIFNNGVLSEILAATTNGTFGSQTFGLTTGTSNCGSKGLFSYDREQEAFAEVAYDEISREMAKGEGEYLTAFATLMGCSADVQDRFATATKAHYGQIFAEGAQPVQVVHSVRGVLRSDAALAKSCSRI